MPGDRPYDLVLFGATGFTGALTAEYLARTAGPDVRWALAGRNQAKLEAVRARLAELNAKLADLPLLHADVTDEDSLRTIAESARVVITTVGPYVNYGEPLVAACAYAGTDYVDLTGEPEFVDRMYVRYNAKAVSTGARLVHCCGFDSVPHDLGVYFTVQHLPEDVPIRVQGFVRVDGSVSGGTLHSAITSMGRPRAFMKAARARRLTEPRPKRRKARVVVKGPRYSRAGRGWALPMPTIDADIVRRSAATVDRYGPEFSYSHNFAPKSFLQAAGLVTGVPAVLALAQFPPTRSWLLGRKQPGEGPTPEQRARSWFKLRFVGEGGDRRVVTEVSGGDPGYDETAKILAESALCLAFDDLPATAGQVTTAAAMGNALIDRLQRAGIAFNVIEGQPAASAAKS